ncbi:MAG: SCO family protein [Rhodospirillales bacterium]
MAKPTADKPGVKPGLLPALLALAVIGVVAVLAVASFLPDASFLSGKEPSGQTPEKASSEKAAPRIGGSFTLVDQDGKTVTDADFKGRFMLIYFGYTFCPDVCPTSLTTMSQALDLLGDKADRIQPLFITVDPERDKPEHLKDYVAFFHPSLVGLSGSLEQVQAAAKAYRVYYAKVEEDPEDPTAYLMDHSSIVYLMGPDGAFVDHFNHDTSPDAMAAKLAQHL